MIYSIVTPDTRGMIGKKQLEMMKPNAYLINSGRLVKQAELMEAIKNKRLAGAAIDVYDIEPA